MKRQILSVLLAALVLTAGCTQTQEETPSYTPTQTTPPTERPSPAGGLTETPTLAPQTATITPAGTPTSSLPEIPVKTVQLPPRGKGWDGPGDGCTIARNYSSGGMLVGLQTSCAKKETYEDGFSYAQQTSLSFKGRGNVQVPVSKTVRFTLPETEATNGASRSHPDFSPWAIATSYNYENPGKPVSDEYLGSTSYVTIENFGESGNVTVTMSVEVRNPKDVNEIYRTHEYAIVFYINKDEKVKVLVDYPANVPRPYSRIATFGGHEIILPHTLYTWTVRYSMPDDTSYGEIYVEKL